MPRRCCGTEPALQGGPDAPFSGAREPGHWHRPVGGKPATPLSKDESLPTLPRRPRSSPPTTAGDGSGPPRGRPTAHPNKMAASPTVWLLTNAPLRPDRKGGRGLSEGGLPPQHLATGRVAGMAQQSTADAVPKVSPADKRNEPERKECPS